VTVGSFRVVYRYQPVRNGKWTKVFFKNKKTFAALLKIKTSQLIITIEMTECFNSGVITAIELEGK